MSKKIAHLSLSKFADLYADKLIGPDFFITDEKQLLSLSEYPYRSDGYIIGICTSVVLPRLRLIYRFTMLKLTPCCWQRPFIY